MSEMMTWAPSWASRTACERPWPRAAPVIRATLPLTRPMCASSPSCAARGLWLSVAQFDDRGGGVGRAPKGPHRRRGVVLGVHGGARHEGVRARFAALCDGVLVHAAVDLKPQRDVAAPVPARPVDQRAGVPDLVQ